MRRPAAVLAVAALAGCGAEERVVSDACTDTTRGIVRALEHAPGSVVLEDGTPLSRCVSEAVDDAVLQNVGTVFTAAASRLSRRAERSPKAALRLGYLVGAVERGAGRTAGFQSELAFRMRTFVDDGRLGGRAGRQAARGRRAGRERG